MANSTDFALYIRQMVMLGWDRHWLTHNMAGIRERFERDPKPFPPPPAPERTRDRYAEL